MRRLYAVAALMGLFLTMAGPAWAAETYRLHVDGLACPFCAYGVEKKLRNTEGVEDVNIRINDGVVLVTAAEDAEFDEAHARRLLQEAGFTLRTFERITEAQ